MIQALVLAALLNGQDAGSRVAELVGEGAFVEALSVADEVSGAEGAWLETWTRHQAGDLSGALTCARLGLRDAPEDLRLLEQAAYICNSLMLPDEALLYAERMIELDDDRGGSQRDHALKLMADRDSIQTSQMMSYLVLACAAALLLWALRMGSLGGSSNQGS
jgi:hypothetical protein